MFKLLLWDVFGRFANQFTTFAVSVILTRLLSPADFGVFGIVMAIVLFSTLFLDFGFRLAVVQAKEISQKQLSTVFFVNGILGILISILLIFGASLIESFYQISGLGNIIAVISVLFVLNGLTLIPMTLLQRQMRIKTIAIVSTLATVVSGTIAVIMAFRDFGIWSLITQQIINASVILTGSFITSRWLPSPILNLFSIKPLWQFGSKLFASSVLEVFFIRLDVFIIGKLFDVATLGFYNRAQSVDGLVKSFSTGTMASLLFPFFSKIQGDKEKMSFYYKRCLHILSFAAFLITGGVFLTSFDVVTIIFTEKWLPVAFYLRLMALFGFTYPLGAMMINILSANGNSDAFLRLQILKMLILLPTFSVLFFAGIYWFLIALGCAGVASLILNAYYVREEIAVSLREQLGIISNYLLSAAVSASVAYLLTFWIDSVYLHFATAGGVFAAIYAFLSYKLKLPGFQELFESAARIFYDKRNKTLSSSD